MEISETLAEALNDALYKASVLKALVLVDGTPPQVAWGLPILPQYLRKYFLRGAPCVAYPDGTVALLSRDEDAVAEFRMTWELAR